jgi:hypothetical protein
MRTTTCVRCGKHFIPGTKHVCGQATVFKPPTQPAAILAKEPVKAPPKPTRRKWETGVYDTDPLLNVGDKMTTKVPSGIDSEVRLAWDCAFKAYLGHKIPAAERLFGTEGELGPSFTLGDFKARIKTDQLNIIDMIWNSITASVSANQAAETMEEPATTEPGKAFCTSHTGKVANAWATHTIGFRCDGRGPERVKTEGFTPLYWFDAGNPQHFVKGTVMASQTDMKLFLDNRGMPWGKPASASRERCSVPPNSLP